MSGPSTTQGSSSYSEVEEGWSQVGFEGGKPRAQHFQGACVHWSLVIGIIGHLPDHIFMQVDQDTLQFADGKNS